jgi:hypothetical protein
MGVKGSTIVVLPKNYLLLSLISKEEADLLTNLESQNKVIWMDMIHLPALIQ